MTRGQNARAFLKRYQERPRPKENEPYEIPPITPVSPPVIAYDNYNRANGALGVTPTGATYVSDGVSAGALSINSNKVVWTAGGTSGQMIIPTVANGEWAADLTVAPGADYTELVFRHVDASNFLIVGITATSFECWECVATVYTRIANVTGLTLNGTYRVRVRAVGDSIVGYLDNVLRFSITETSNQTGTGAGPRLRAANQAFDNLMVEGINP